MPKDDKDDQIHKIVPVKGGFEAVWGFDPAKGKSGPVHDWSTDELTPYTKTNATVDALIVDALDGAKRNG